MNRFLMIGCVVLVTALSAHGATMCSGESVAVKLDLATGTRAISASETIRYSTAWVDGAAADAMAVVEVNGETLSSMAGSGAVTWTPQHNGNYTLTHKVMSGGTQIGETLTATFFVEPADPVLNPVSGTTFDSSLSVSMTCPTEGATIHFTTNGTEPTAESPVYKRFKISGKTTVKAVAVKDGMLSEVVTAEYALGQCADPVIDAVTVFTGSWTKVTISCATDGATIRYTLDGSEPNSNATKYAKPFYVTGSCTVRAYAVKAEFFDSEVSDVGIERVWGIGDTLGKPDHRFSTSGDGDKAFYRVVDAFAPNGEAMHSGDIGNSSAYGSFAQTLLSTTVTGPGTVNFSWKASCEDDAPDYKWDHGEFAVDGVARAYISGEADWTNVSVEVTGPGEHTLTWTYLKDDVESEGEDCIWVGGFGWESAEPYTHTTEVPVPYAWLTAHDPGVVDEYEAYEASAKATVANGRKVWECYVVGLDPENGDATNDFRIVSFPMKADGTPDLENLAFEPPHAQWNVQGARAVIKGAAALDAADWPEVTEQNKAGFRFFKVEVELP